MRYIVGFGAFLDAQQLAFPKALERARPFVQRPDGYCVHPVKHLATLPVGLHQANTFQNFQVLRNRRLLHLHCVHNLGDGPLLHREIVQDVPAARFCYGVEGV